MRVPPYAKIIAVAMFATCCLVNRASAETSTTAGYISGTGSALSSSAYAASLSRAPGLSPDLTSFFWQGLYVTPAMVFTVPVNSYSESSMTPRSFIPRNTSSSIIFSNLPVSGSALPASQVLPVRFSYSNASSTNQSYIVHDDVFDPSGYIISSSTITRSAGDSAPFELPLYFGGTTSVNGSYGVRVRVYDARQEIVQDENSFNITLQP